MGPATTSTINSAAAANTMNVFLNISQFSFICFLLCDQSFEFDVRDFCFDRLGIVL
jgi:hypothetical protein